MDVNELLKTAHSKGASDLHLKVGSCPILRINGELSVMSDENRLTQEDRKHQGKPGDNRRQGKGKGS